MAVITKRRPSPASGGRSTPAGPSGPTGLKSSSMPSCLAANNSSLSTSRVSGTPTSRQSVSCPCTTTCSMSCSVAPCCDRMPVNSAVTPVRSGPVTVTRTRSVAKAAAV